MSIDPYKPPSSNLEVPDVKRGSALKAVALGLLTDLGGTTVMSTLAAIAYAGYLGAYGSTPEQIGAAMGNFDSGSALGVGLGIVGSLFSVLGGFVCARIAKHSEYRLGIVMSVISVILGVLMTGEATHPAMTAIFLIATVASIMAGIHLGVMKNRQARAAALR